MRGNSHVQFLMENAAETPPPGDRALFQIFRQLLGLKGKILGPFLCNCLAVHQLRQRLFHGGHPKGRIFPHERADFIQPVQSDSGSYFIIDPQNFKSGNQAVAAGNGQKALGRDSPQATG